MRTYDMMLSHIVVSDDEDTYKNEMKNTTQVDMLNEIT